VAVIAVIGLGVSDHAERESATPKRPPSATKLASESVGQDYVLRCRFPSDHAA